ncbi:MAG: hydrolase [Sulfurovum sp.]|nr:hydrolase [Sulfurovaceae bacterium]
MKPFNPAIGISNAHSQTLFPSLFRKLEDLDYDIEIFELSDGDFVECYWYNKQAENAPIVILFHGLEGSYSSPYIIGMMQTLKSSGYRAVLMHFRGCATKENRLARCYHSGETNDAKEFIYHLRDRYKETSLFAIGYSLGGNMLLKLLGEYGTQSPLTRAVSISAPLDLSVCANKINKGFSKIYQFRLMRHLKSSLLAKYRVHDMKNIIGIDEHGVKNMKTFWDFDNIYTGPIHGFRNAQHYYEESSAKGYLKNIETKTLIIHSLDDPFMTPEILPTSDEVSNSIDLEIYNKGGHVGFVAGSILRPKYWLEDRIMEYFNRL